jgi:hypothetical protein
MRRANEEQDQIAHEATSAPRPTGPAGFEAKFMLPWSFSEEAAAEKCQHNMWVTNAKLAVRSVITGGGKWVEIAIPADQLYLHLLLTAEKKFWRCVERLFGIEPPRPRIEAVRIVDMSQLELLGGICGQRAKTELKALLRRRQGGVRAWRPRTPPLSPRRNRSSPPGKVARRHDRGESARRGPDLSISPALERARHHPQGAGPATDCHGSDDRDRCFDGNGELDDRPGPRLRRMDRLRLARVPARRYRDPASDGGRPDLRASLRAVHPGRHRGRGRRRCARPVLS